MRTTDDDAAVYRSDQRRFKSHKQNVAMQAIFFAWYNLCRKHETIKGQTPAMAAAITARPRTVKELLQQFG
jgi:hypothetical protein